MVCKAHWVFNLTILVASQLASWGTPPALADSDNPALPRDPCPLSPIVWLLDRIVPEIALREIDPEPVSDVAFLAGPMDLQVVRDGIETTYLSTDRGLKPPHPVVRTLTSLSQFVDDTAVPDFYAPGVIDLAAWQGKTIVDTAAGQGSFVDQVRAERDRQGLDFKIVGLDLNMRRNTRRNRHLFRGDMSRMPFANASADIMLCTYGPPSYELGRNNAFVAQVLSEYERVLKPGGSALVSPINDRQLAILKTLLTGVPGLELVQPEGYRLPGKFGRLAQDIQVEIRKKP